MGLYSKGQKGLIVTWLKLSKKIWKSQATRELKNKTGKEKDWLILYFKETEFNFFLNLRKIAAIIRLPTIAPKIE